MCDAQTVTSETSIPGANAEEMALNDLISNVLLPGYLEQSGYDLDRVETTAPDLTPEQRKRYETLANKNREIKRSGFGDERMSNPFFDKNVNLTNEEWQEMQTLITMEKSKGKITETYKLRKKADKETEGIREKYGKDSEEYKQALTAYEESQTQSESLQNEIVQTFKENSLKFLQGDFSISEREKNQISEMLKPQREAVMSMYDRLEDQTSVGFDKMFEDHKELYQKNRDLLKDQVAKYGETVTNQMAAQAAAIGRDPLDPEFQLEISQAIAEQAMAGGKALSISEAEQSLGLSGARLEAETGITRGRGAANVNLAEQGMGLRMQKFSPMGAQIAMNTSQLSSALNQQALQNLGAASGMFQQQVSGMRQERMSQPTTSQYSPAPSPLSGIIGATTGLVSAYSGFSSASALKAMLNRRGTQGTRTGP